MIAMKSLSFSLFPPTLSLSYLYSLSAINTTIALLFTNSTEMCDSSPFLLFSFSSRHHRRPIRVHRLLRRMRFAKREAKDRSGVKVEMEIKNLKLYMENQSIIEENERLRKKAFHLHKENQVLFSQLQSFSKQNSLPNSD